ASRKPSGPQRRSLVQTLEHSLVALSHKRSSEPVGPQLMRAGRARNEQVALSHKVLDGFPDCRLVDELRKAPENGRVCFGWHSVPKVEYMTRPPSGTREDSARLGFNPLPRTKQNGRIQVPLNAVFFADFGPAEVQGDPP